jgi:hypothetical protein
MRGMTARWNTNSSDSTASAKGLRGWLKLCLVSSTNNAKQTCYCGWGREGASFFGSGHDHVLVLSANYSSEFISYVPLFNCHCMP